MILRLISYDIENDRYRTKLAAKLESLGYLRLQYSVFCGMHTQVQWKQCLSAINALHNKYGKPGDKIYAIVLGKKMFEKMECIGTPPAIEAILEKELTCWF